MRNSHGTKDFVTPNRNMSRKRTNNDVSNFGSCKDGWKDKKDRKKTTEQKKSDSLVGAKMSPKKLSDGHFASLNSCLLDSAWDDECRIYL